MQALHSIDNTKTDGSLRDEQLDIYRALIMIYIVCVVHAAFYLNVLSEPVKSIILFEMPVIFYISGAALRVSNKHRNFISTICNRANRVLLPYYAFALIGIILFTVINMDSENNPIWLFISKAWHSIYPSESSIPLYHTEYIWFIFPYFIISCSFFFQQKWTNRINPYLYLCILLCLCILTQILTENETIRNIVFYNFFFMSGYLLYKRISVRILYFFTVISIIIFIAIFATSWKGSMQTHKFPCDILFLFYGIISLSIFGLIFTYVRVPNNVVFKWWNKKGYTIYLWQTFAITATAEIFSRLPGNILNGTQGFFVAFVLMFINASIISIFAVPYEKCFIKRMFKISSAIVNRAH